MVLGGSMTVKDVIKVVADILMLDDVSYALDSGYTESYDKTLAEENGETVFSDDTINEIRLLVTSFNLTNNIIATNYLEILDSYVLKSNGKIMYKDICDGRVFLAVKGVYDMSGNKVQYTLTHDGIRVGVGEYEVRVALFPKDHSLSDEILDYSVAISDKILAYGVASEYLLIKGDVDSASVYDLRFKQNLLDAIRPRRNIFIKESKFI